jgi:hypothetical protein
MWLYTNHCALNNERKYIASIDVVHNTVVSLSTINLQRGFPYTIQYDYRQSMDR